MAVSLSRTFVVGVVGLAFLFALTPVSATYALDYRVTASAVQSGEGNVSNYADLNADLKAALDGATAGEGQWYRSRADAPDAFPLVYRHGDTAYIASLENQYHWSTWRGKVPVATLAIGLACVAIVTREQLHGMIRTDEF